MATNVEMDLFIFPDFYGEGKVELKCENSAHTSQIYTNVTHDVQHYEPFAFHWGYLGARPSELALNILQPIFTENRDWTSGRVRHLYDGWVWEEVWYLHKKFVADFLADLPSRKDAEILVYDIEKWILKQLPGL